jgi:nitronate monooxygenase
MSMPALFKGRLSLPVIGAPLFIISVPDLVIAQCKAGVVGSFPALNARPPALLDEWLARIKEELAAYDKAHPERPSAPFAVNQDRAQVEQPARSGSGALRKTQGADDDHLARGARGA